MIRLQQDAEEPGLRWLVLDRPDKANALDEFMVSGLVEALADAEAGSVRTVALASNHRHFCAGLDLSVGGGASDDGLSGDGPSDDEGTGDGAGTAGDGDAVVLQRLTRIAMLLERIRTLRIATAVVVAGGAFGAGADLSLACQHRVAVDGATWTFPGVRFGIALGTHRLSSLVGPDRARQILLSQAKVDANQARQWGLVHEVVPDQQAARESVRDFARRVGRLAPQTVATILELTDRPGRDAAVGALARSVAEGSICARIGEFRKALAHG